MDGYEVPEGKLNARKLAEGDQHQWIVAAMFSVSQARAERMLTDREAATQYENREVLALDHENLESIQGPGCFKCEQLLSPVTVRSKCPVFVTIVQVG